MCQTNSMGPWRPGRLKGTVVSDTPTGEISGSDDVDYYGGFLVAESVSARNVSFIAAAPTMLKALLAARDEVEGTAAHALVVAAIAEATKP